MYLKWVNVLKKFKDKTPEYCKWYVEALQIRRGESDRRVTMFFSEGQNLVTAGEMLLIVFHSPYVYSLSLLQNRRQKYKIYPYEFWASK